MQDSLEKPEQRASAEFRERLERLDRQASAAPMGALDHRATADLRACQVRPGLRAGRVIVEMPGRRVSPA